MRTWVFSAVWPEILPRELLWVSQDGQGLAWPREDIPALPGFVTALCRSHETPQLERFSVQAEYPPIGVDALAGIFLRARLDFECGATLLLTKTLRDVISLPWRELHRWQEAFIHMEDDSGESAGRIIIEEWEKAFEGMRNDG